MKPNNHCEGCNCNDCQNNYKCIRLKYKVPVNCNCPPGPTGPTGATGVTGPTGATGPTGNLPDAYARYITSGRVSNNSLIGLTPDYNVGNLTSLSPDGNTINLAPGYVYQVCYTLEGTNPSDFRFQVLNVVNGSFDIFSQTSSSNMAMDGSAIGSASTCFLVIARNPSTVSLRFSTNSATSPAVTGNVTVHPIASLS